MMLFGSIRGCKGKVSLFDLLDEWRVNEFSSDQVKDIGTKIPRTGIGAVVKAGFQKHFSVRQVSQKLLLPKWRTHFRSIRSGGLNRRSFDWCGSSSRCLFEGTVRIKRIVLAYIKCKFETDQTSTWTNCTWHDLMLFGTIRGCKGKVSLFDLLDEWMNFLLIRWRILGQRSPEQGLELWWRQDFRSISVFDKCLRNCSYRNEGHTLDR